MGGPGSRSHPCTRHQVTGDRTDCQAPGNQGRSVTPPGPGRGALAGKCFWECGQWDWTGPTMWLCLDPLGLHQGWGSHSGSPAHEHTDPAAGLSFPETLWAFRGDTHHLACHVPAGSLEAPSPGQNERSLDMAENHLGRDGGTLTPCFLLLVLSSVLCLFLSLWRLPACGWLRLWAW